MKKEEFLAMSLPYGVKCFSNQTNVIYDITSMSFWNKCLVRVKPNNERDFLLPTSKILPILRPLTDLTKPITQRDYNNGEPFVPIERIKESQHHLFFRDDITNPINGLQFSEFSKLLSWHFNLMDEGEEFIDVNTLNINPYA